MVKRVVVHLLVEGAFEMLSDGWMSETSSRIEVILERLSAKTKMY